MHYIRAGSFSTFTAGQEYDMMSGSTVPENFGYAVVRHYSINILGLVAGGAASGDVYCELSVLPASRGAIQKRVYAHAGVYVVADAAVSKADNANVTGSPNLVLAPTDRLGVLVGESGDVASAGYATVSLEVFPSMDTGLPPVPYMPSWLELIFGGRNVSN